MTTIETKAAIKLFGKFNINGKVIELRKSRKEHLCLNCGLPIPAKSFYYSVTFGGAGLGSLKFPDRIHLDCVDNYLDFGGKHG